MDLQAAFVTYLMLLFSLCVHEFGHAWTAHLCGDDTARLQGRMTLNPFAHIDPIGTALIPMVQLLSPVPVPIFGWAKPVPVNPRNFGRYRRDDMLVSLAGIFANFCIAIGAAVLIRCLALVSGGLDHAPLPLVRVLYMLFAINVLLGVFNLIPIPPLDGFQFGKHFLPMHVRWNVHKFYQYGPFILLFLLFTGGFRAILGPVMAACQRIAFWGL